MFNFRDIGGYETPDGPVGTGLLFRSNALWALGDEDLGRLRASGVRTAVDVRLEPEIAQAPTDLRGYDVVTHLNPIGVMAKPGEEWTLDGYLLGLVDDYGESFAHVVSLLCDPDSHPAVFSCSSGKDRTGVITALVQSTLGVSDSDIRADFARTSDLWPPGQTEKSVAAGMAGGVEEEVIRRAMAAPPELIQLVLDHIRERHGTTEAYLLAHGTTRAELVALRAALLPYADVNGGETPRR